MVPASGGLVLWLLVTPIAQVLSLTLQGHPGHTVMGTACSLPVRAWVTAHGVLTALALSVSGLPCSYRGAHTFCPDALSCCSHKAQGKTQTLTLGTLRGHRH